MRLVVIGGLAAGLNAATRARRVDPNLDILVLEKGPRISYGVCALPYYVEGRVQSLRQLILNTTEGFERKYKIPVRTGAEVASIAHPRRELMLTGGERVGYDRLVIATGSRPVRRIPGAHLPNVFTLHSLEDAVRLKDHLTTRRPRRAVVIGAGFLGLELAEVLRSHGLAVTLIEQSEHVLNRPDPALRRVVEAQLQRFRIDARFATPAAQIEIDRVGDTPCDLVALTTGFEPNVELARDAGIELGRSGAIRVDERMETSFGSVFAAGDCAETTHLVTGRPIRVALATVANKMGRVAGASAAGLRDRFSGTIGTSLVRVCGLGVGLTGLSAPQARQEGFDAVEATLESRERPAYFFGTNSTVQLVADRRSGRILGGFVAGERGVKGHINVIATAVTMRMRVDDFEQLDLAYTPPYSTVWDPLLLTARQLKKKL
jgi:NADPH-dependent 2,4-dienoyl-CoA reductase/sulfur reductase-like enzyme